MAGASGVTAPTAIAEAIRQHILGDPPTAEWNAGEEQPVGLFYDLDIYDSGLRNVQDAFGPGILCFLFHADAVIL